MQHVSWNRGGVGILRHYSGIATCMDTAVENAKYITFPSLRRVRRDPGTVSDVTQLVSARHAAIYIVCVVDTVRQIAWMTLTLCVIVYAG